MPTGEYEEMVEKDLPFGPRTARRLVAIGRNPRWANRTTRSVLPPYWRILYEFTQLSDDEFVEAESKSQPERTSGAVRPSPGDLARFCCWLRPRGDSSRKGGSRSGCFQAQPPATAMDVVRRFFIGWGALYFPFDFAAICERRQILPRGGYRPGAGRPKRSRPLEPGPVPAAPTPDAQKALAGGPGRGKRAELKPVLPEGDPGVSREAAELAAIRYLTAVVNDETVDGARRDRAAISLLSLTRLKPLPPKRREPMSEFDRVLAGLKL